MNRGEADFPVRPRFQDDDEKVENRDSAEENEEDEEDEGEDIMKADGNLIGSNDEDSSEEEDDDDPEEARRIAEGFIVDEDEDDADVSDRESRRRKRKAERRRKRQEEQEQEELDEDDLELLAENTGIRQKQRQLKRFRRASATPPQQAQKDLQHMFDDDDEIQTSAARRLSDDEDEDLPRVGAALRANALQREFATLEDEMDDFIDDDEEFDEDDAMSEGEREVVRAERRQKRREELEERRARRNDLGFDPLRAGIDAEAWAELNDVFGDGSEYAEFLKDDDKDDQIDEEMFDVDGIERTVSRVKKDAGQTLESIFEPSAIKDRMMTIDDIRIKKEDIPERFQKLLPGDEGITLLERRLTQEELDECTRWVSKRFSSRSKKLFLTDTGELATYRDAWFRCVRTMVELINNEKCEAMYLFTHRIDDYEYRDGEQVTELLQRRDFAALVASCMKFKTLLDRRDKLRTTFDRIIDDGGEPVSDMNSTIFQQIIGQTESVEEVADVADWLIATYGQRMRDAQAIRDLTFKRPTVIGPYEQLKGTIVKKFAERFGISSLQLAENIRGTSRAHFTEDEEKTPMTLGDEYINTIQGPQSAQAAIESARKLLAHEIGNDPTIRREARKLISNAGLISVQATDRGQFKIDEENPYYNFKFLTEKPVIEFTSIVANEKLPAPAQYLMMTKAEEQALVEIKITIRDSDAKAFEKRLLDNYSSEGLSENSRLWNNERQRIIRQALEEHLYPRAKIWIREWLRDECSEFIGRACEVALTKRIDCQPYESKSMQARKFSEVRKQTQTYGQDIDSDDEDDAEGSIIRTDAPANVPRVLAISNGKGDPRKDEIQMVFLDAGGRLRERVAFETLMKPRSDPNEMQVDGADKAEQADPSREFKQLLKDRKPDVIVIGGFSPRTLALREQVQSLVNELKGEYRQKDRSLTEDQLKAMEIDVIQCYDDVARLYQHSDRANAEFPSLSILSRYCVALARYVQSPVQEFAALNEDDLAAIRYDNYQNLIPKERLLLSLERALVAIVNTVCVDINRCSIDPYYACMLQYVAGLGPRKVDELMRAINSKLNNLVINREALWGGAADSQIRENSDWSPLLSSTVFFNACSFLLIRIRQDTKQSRRFKLQGKPDALDSTRIHPESYDYARFIAFDALRKTEEDREEGQHPSLWCEELMRDEGRRSKIEDIDMADYERNLWAEMARQGQRRQRKLSQLEFIARELVEPVQEQRHTFSLPNSDDILTMLSGETRATFDNQRIVTVTVQKAMRDYAIVHLESGIEGTIHREYLLPQDSKNYRSQYDVPLVRDLVKHGQTLKALIIDVDMQKLRAELTARPSHIEAGKSTDNDHRKVEVDSRYFDRDRARSERNELERTRQRRKNAESGSRFIRHPNFQNFKAGKAEEALLNAPRGTAIVRPSSKGDDHLAVTWKVDDGVFQHFDVIELDKEPHMEIGRILRVSNVGGASYSDIDELLVNHVAPMAQMVEMLMSNEKYQGSEEQLQRYLTNFSLANPTRSQYGFAIDKKRAGLFILGFKAKKDAPIQRWFVRVLPGRYKLNEAELPDVVSLCNAFKTQYTTRSMRSSDNIGSRSSGNAMLSGGITPHFGGSTGIIRPLGAATPYGVGLATPNPYSYNGNQNVYGRGPPPGAPPSRPGPPPTRPPNYAQQPPPPPSRQSAGIHPDRLAQMGAGGALNGRR